MEYLVLMTVLAQCESLKVELMKQSTLSGRRDVKERRRQHLEDQRAERMFYYECRYRAHQDPAHYACIILDGNDATASLHAHLSQGWTKTRHTFRTSALLQRSSGTAQGFPYTLLELWCTVTVLVHTPYNR